MSKTIAKGSDKNLQRALLFYTRTSSDVVPVSIIRGKFLECCGLDKIGPYWNLDL
jgi:hypothetical protein